MCNCLLLLVFVFLCNALLHCLATTNLAVTLPPLFFGEILYEVSMIISLAYLLVEYPMIDLNGPPTMLEYLTENYRNSTDSSEKLPLYKFVPKITTLRLIFC